MGQNTDAYLVYGYVWDEEHDLFVDEEDGEGWAKRIATKRGLANPWNNYPQAEISALPYNEQRAPHDQWLAQNQGAVSAWWDALAKIEKEYGCETDSHCSADYRMPIVKIADAGKRAARGDVVEVKPDDLQISEPEWDAALERFVTDLEIDTSGAHGPGWFLLSYWG